jgi:hypothetical protein
MRIFARGGYWESHQTDVGRTTLVLRQKPRDQLLMAGGVIRDAAMFLCASVPLASIRNTGTLNDVNNLCVHRSILITDYHPCLGHVVA